MEISCQNSFTLFNVRTCITEETSKHIKIEGLRNSLILHSTEAAHIGTSDRENIG